MLAFGFQRKVDHHDGVLFHDTHQQNDPNHRHDGQIGAGNQQRQQRPQSRGREGGDDRQRMDQALVQHPQDDVDRDQRGRDQHQIRPDRLPLPPGGADEFGAHALGHAQVAHRLIHSVLRDTLRNPRCEVEAQRRGGILALMLDREGGGAAFEPCHRRERNLLSCGGPDI